MQTPGYTLLLLGIILLLGCQSSNDDSRNHVGKIGKESELPVIKKPEWVKEYDVSYTQLDTSDFNQSKYLDNNRIYQEVQINLEANEYFEKQIFRAEANRYDNNEIKLCYSSKDEIQKIVAVTKIIDSIEIDVTQKINWKETQSSEYVARRLWESNNCIKFSIDGLEEDDLYGFSYVETLLREDYNYQEGFLIFSRDKEYCRFRVLSDEPLFSQSYNDAPELMPQKIGNKYEYFAEGIMNPPYSDDVPPYIVKYPTIMYSSFSDYQPVADKFNNYFETSKKSDEALDRLFESLTQGIGSKEQQLTEIINYVQDTMQYQFYGLYKAYQPDWCIAGNRGDCKAKTLIMTELMNRLGIQANPVLVRSNGYVYELDSITSLVNFDHVIVQFIWEQDTILIDPTITGQTDRIGGYHVPYLGKGLVIEKNGFYWIDMPSQNEGLVEIYDEVSDKVSRKVVLSGKFADDFRERNIEIMPRHSLFEGRHFFFGIKGIYTLHDFTNYTIFGADISLVQMNDYNDYESDSLILEQELYFADSTFKKPFVPRQRRTHRNQRKWPYSSTPYSSADTLYKGEWRFPFLHQKIRTVYHKFEIPLAEVDFSQISEGFEIKRDFGFYKCLWEETDSTYIANQEIYVSASLPQDRETGYNRFFEEIEGYAAIVWETLKAE